MPRIRSVHPGLFTDEEFVSLSIPARIFLIGVWVDADDHGVFEWKPVSLKMRLFPADNIDVLALLEELCAANQVSQRECDGKQYGIVRNFCRWQRPKNPAYKHPFPPEWVEYVAFKQPDVPITPQALPHASPSRGVKAPQREEGAGVEVEGEEVNIDDGGREPRGERLAQAAEMALIAPVLFKRFSDAYPAPVPQRGSTRQKFFALVKAGEADEIIAAAPRANPEMPAEQWLDEQGWKQLTLPIPVKHSDAPLISPEATTLANEIAKLAGQDLEFIEPGWCGAPYRVQQWLTQGWQRELILSAVERQIARHRGEKIGGVKYFEKGIARFIAENTEPVPVTVNRPAQIVEVSRETTRNDPRSGLAAINRLYDRLEGQMQHPDGEDVPDASVQRLPAG